MLVKLSAFKLPNDDIFTPNLPNQVHEMHREAKQ